MISLEQRLQSSLFALGAAEDERFAVAVSGGADSTALLHLARLARTDLHVLHVDHALRPDSASDARAVRRLAESLGLACTVVRAPVVRSPRTSLEAAARDARYAALDRAADDAGCRLVATAHTRDDQAETVLLRALRGAGPRGLRGIASVRGRFVRPLLDVARSELTGWLRAHDIQWLHDETNDDLTYDRNWIRAVVLPTLERRRGGASAALARVAARSRDDADALDEIAAERMLAVRRRAPGWIDLPLGSFAPPRAVAVRVAIGVLGLAGAHADDRSVDAVMGVAAGRSRIVALPRGLAACLTGTTLSVVAPTSAPASTQLDPGVTTHAAEWGIRVRVSSPPARDAWSWRCSLEQPAARLSLRGRRPGDRVPTALGTRKVQDVLVDAKIPRHARDRIPLLCADDVPVAVVGLNLEDGWGPNRLDQDGGPARWRSLCPPYPPARLVVDVEPLEGDWWSARP